jgi:hypothetical protein
VLGVGSYRRAARARRSVATAACSQCSRFRHSPPGWRHSQRPDSERGQVRGRRSGDLAAGGGGGRRANSDSLGAGRSGDAYPWARYAPLWWAALNPAAWALAWLITYFVITTNVKEHFTNFGAGGALVFALLTWLLLKFLFQANDRDGEPLER